MAACCTNVGVGGGSFLTALPSNVRPQPFSSISLRCCCTQVSQRMSWANSILRPPGSTKESRARGQKTKRSWRQERLLVQTSCCLLTDVSSSDAASTEQNVVEGNESGVSIEEKEAIIAFEEGRSPGAKAEEGNSSKDLQLSSEGDVAAMEKPQEIHEILAMDAVKGQGATIANMVTLYVNLLGRPSPGDGKMLAATGSAVLQGLEEEVGKLQAVEGVNGQSLFEILRLVKLLRVDIQLVAAARKGSTLSERLQQTKAHCLQLLNIAGTL